MLYHEIDPEDAMQTRMIHPLKLICILNNHPQIISLASHEVAFNAIARNTSKLIRWFGNRLTSGSTSGLTLGTLLLVESVNKEKLGR